MAKEQKFKDAEKEIYEFITRQKKLCEKLKERMLNGKGHLNGKNGHCFTDFFHITKATE